MSVRSIKALLSQKKFSDALSLIEKEKTSLPEADAHYLKGFCHYFQGEIPKALIDLKRSLESSPGHTDAAICLSVLYNDIGRYQDAQSVFEKANQSVNRKGAGEDPTVDRQFAQKHLELADLYFRYRRFDEAIDEYGKAVLLSPNELDPRIRRAKALAKKGFVSRAIQELQLLKQDFPHEEQVRIQLGLLHFSQGNVLDAELEWEHVVEFNPHHDEAKGYLKMAKESRLNPNTEAPAPSTS